MVTKVDRGPASWIERIWKRTQWKRWAEARRVRDVMLEAAKRANVCAETTGTAICGWPLNDAGLCFEHDEGKRR